MICLSCLEDGEHHHDASASISVAPITPPRSWALVQKRDAGLREVARFDAAYFFGCAPSTRLLEGVRRSSLELGHYLFQAQWSPTTTPPSWRKVHEDALVDFALDGVYAPLHPQTRKELDEGVCRTVVVGAGVRALTIVAWWDRSVDTRPGSNSAVIISGKHDGPTALAAGKAMFPWAFDRMAFPLVAEVRR
jgi:hypothetical protein